MFPATLTKSALVAVALLTAVIVPVVSVGTIGSSTNANATEKRKSVSAKDQLVLQSNAGSDRFEKLMVAATIVTAADNPEKEQPA